MGVNTLEIEPFKWEGKLPHRYLHHLLLALRPLEPVLLQSLLVETEPIPIPEEDLQSRPVAVTEHKQMSRKDIECQGSLHHHGKAIDLLSHVRRSQGQIDPGVGGQRDHRSSRTWSNRSRV
jgi:hypothetical protein